MDREGRIKNYDALREILAEKFRSDTREHVLRVLDEHDVPAAPIQNFQEVFEDPQVRHLGMEVEMHHPRMGSMHLAGSGIQMSETPPRMKLPPPIMGENTDEILSKLGYSQQAISELRGKGVI